MCFVDGGIGNTFAQSGSRFNDGHAHVSTRMSSEINRHQSAGGATTNDDDVTTH
jgi:hypothetical protein